MKLFVVVLILLFCVVNSFVMKPSKLLRSSKRNALKEVAVVGEIKNGDRKLVETENGTVIVANVGGSLYAVNAKCPHLGLPMKKGKIEIENGTPTITCNFHNSKFSIEDGKCTAWCTGVLGMPNSGFLGGMMGAVGGEKNTPATTYKVSITEDNKVMIDM